MEKITVVMYAANCGKKYQSRSGCVAHEKVCKCFTNPKFRACHSCKFNGGLESEDGERYRNCLHPDWDYDRMKPFNIPNTATFDCINCPFHKSKNPFNGASEKWIGYAKNQTVNTSLPVSGDGLPF